MKNEASGKYLIFKGELKKVEDKYFDRIEKIPVYEVVTVIQGIPLFFEEHMERLEKTCEMLNIELKRSKKEIEKDFYEIIKADDFQSGNIKLLLLDGNFLIYKFKATHPTEKDLKNGVNAAYFEYERENPNAKLLRNDFKAAAAKIMREKNVFEVILKSKDGSILEGSRTNLYFIKDDYLITAPGDKVLRGITRQRLEKLFQKLNIKTVEKVVYEKDVQNMDGAFFSGTTVDVVPIRKIEDMELNTQENKLMQKIIKGYKDLQTEYINSKKVKTTE